MVVAMPRVGVVQVTGDQVVDMLAVGQGVVTAPRAVLVLSGMAATSLVRDTLVGVGAANGDGVLVHVASVNVMKVSVVKIVRMSLVADGGVPAPPAVDVPPVVLML